MARPEQKQSFYAAVGGVLAAGSLALLWLACAAPSGRIGFTAAAGLFPMAAAMYAGRRTGYLCWAASAVLGLLILPDKIVGLLYLTFLGLYPVVKGRLETLGRLDLEWGLKLASFNLVLTLFWFVFQELFLPQAPAWLAENTLLAYGLGNLLFVAYDLGLSQIVARIRAYLMRRKSR